MVGDCGSLGAVGEWQKITPPDIVVQSGDKLQAFAFAVDPVNSGTVYFGTAYQHQWKSTDCGSTWAPGDSGRNGEAWNHAMNWTFVVDPIEPNVVYTNSGYGDHGSGLWKSIDSGANWDAAWPPANQPELDGHLTYNFANVLVMDPADHKHLILTFHETCMLDGAQTCIAESKDAGTTWKLIAGQADWNGGEGQILYFLDASDHWIWGSQTNGFYRTENGGASWTQLKDEHDMVFSTSHLQGSGMYRTAADVYYLAAANGLYRSTDAGKTWTSIPDTGPISGGMLGDGETLYTSRCYFGGFCQERTDFLLTSPESDGLTWTVLPSPPMTEGGSLGFDKGHDLLFSSNGADGFWRVRTR